MRARSASLGVLLFGLLTMTAANAGWRDLLGQLPNPTRDRSGPASRPIRLGEPEMADALKQALRKGIRHAVKQLGRKGGFLDDAQVRIPMPKQLRWLQSALRAVGQGRLADEFVIRMNHAAEQAVPAAVAVFGNAVQSMTFADARRILTGPPDAATVYFRAHTEDQLTQRMLPIVRAATARAGVTAYYKRLLGALGPAAGYLGNDTVDLDSYITRRALDGLFLKIADEERQIREYPAARTTALLKKVFSAYAH